MPSILLISSEFPPGPGGIGSHAYNLCMQLSKLGWAVRVVARQDYASEREVNEFNSKLIFNIIRLNPVPSMILEFLYRSVVIAFILITWRPEVVIVSGERQVWLVALFVRFGLIRQAVAAGHGIEFGVTSYIRKQVSKWAYGSFEVVVCGSEYTRQCMEMLGIRPTRTEVIHYGADETKYFSLPVSEIDQFRSRLGFSKKERLLLTVGNVTERKGQEVVIRAMPMILQEMPDAHYLVVGMPTLKEKLHELCEQLGVQNHVHFLGRLAPEDLTMAYNACDLFVMTSRHTSDGDFEGYGIAVIEAALCGKAAVVAGNSGLAEAVIDQQTGIVVPENDPVATANTIIALLRDDALRARISSNAREYAGNEATWSKRVEQYDRLLRSLLV